MVFLSRGVLTLVSSALIHKSAAIAEGGRVTETVGWQSDPDGRGTFTLVSSCLFTLAICVYSAMHLNVPPRAESIPMFWWRNIRWALLGVFGPELVVFIAWKQYLSAKAIVKGSQKGAVGKEGPQREGHTEKHPDMDTMACGSTDQDHRLPWTIVHGFCADMGCFTFQTATLSTDIGTPILDSRHRRLTLTARGVALLAECGLLPNIEKGYLNDKSKSDGLSKFIACVQAAWLIVQVVGRLTLGLQVTLLEINTLGHVFCALLIYVLWWHKPRMVQEPINLDGDWLGSLCAYMYMSSSISGQTRRLSGTFKEAGIEPEMSSVALFPEEPCKNCIHRVEMTRNRATRHQSDSTLSIREWTSRKEDPVSSTSNNHSRTPESITRCNISGSLGPRPGSAKSSLSSTKSLDSSEEISDFGAARGLRWCLATEAVLTYPAIKRRFTPISYVDPSGTHMTCLQQIQCEELVEEHASNWSTKGLLPGDYGLVMGMALWFASMAFGAIHAAAWYDYFPTPIESWLWRCSAVYISWSGLVWCLINLAAHLSKPFDDYWNRTRMLKPPFARSLPLVVVCIICGAMYTFARMYLVIEAFISIRKLPVSAYQTPDWTQLIPHL